MRRTTEQLIAELARDASPVRRLQPPLRRAAAWLALVGVLAGAGVALMADVPGFLARAADPRFAIELGATLATGLLGVIAAFELSVPDRPRSWIFAPVPPLALWISSSGYQCWKTWTGKSGDSWAADESARCFVFILGAGFTLGLLLYWPLRRARPIDPGAVAAAAGLGAAGLASFILQFFHSFDVTFMDLGLHLAAVGLLLAAFWRLGRRGLGDPGPIPG